MNYFGGVGWGGVWCCGLGGGVRRGWLVRRADGQDYVQRLIQFFDEDFVIVFVEGNIIFDSVHIL